MKLITNTLTLTPSPQRLVVASSDHAPTPRRHLVAWTPSGAVFVLK